MLSVNIPTPHNTRHKFHSYNTITPLYTPLVREYDIRLAILLACTVFFLLFYCVAPAIPGIWKWERESKNQEKLLWVVHWGIEDPFAVEMIGNRSLPLEG